MTLLAADKVMPEAPAGSMPPTWARFWATQDRVLLAPMEGVVDWVLRDVITRIGGVDLCVTEFIRVTDRLLPDSSFYKDCPELLSDVCATQAGVPVLVQLLGGKPQPMAENAARAAQLGAPGIDINFGCPAKTVNRHDGGAALLKDPHRIHDVVSAVRKSVPSHLPVSAKVRLGFADKERHLEIAQAAENGGAAWLTVHARTRDEGYRPPAHWEYIAKMSESISIPVIANGDIWTEDDYRRCREVSKCRHVMMGRGLMATPDLALLVRNPASTVGGAARAEWPRLAHWVEDFAKKSAAFRNEHYAVCRTKQWLKSLARRSTEAALAFENIKLLNDLADILILLRRADQFSAEYKHDLQPENSPQSPN